MRRREREREEGKKRAKCVYASHGINAHLWLLIFHAGCMDEWVPRASIRFDSMGVTPHSNFFITTLYTIL